MRALKIALGFSLIIFGTTMAFAQQKEDPSPQSFKLIQKTPQTKEIEQKSKKIAPPETKPAYGGGYYAGKAWEYYKIGNYEQAIDLFVFALSFPEAKQEAKLGLAFCYIKQKNNNKAILFFEELAKKKYKLQAILPSLINLFLREGNYKKANFYLQGLEVKEKRKWEKLIQESEMRKKFSTAQKSGDMHALEQLINVYQKELKKCITPELFYDTAKIFAVRERRKEALNLYQELLNVCSNRWGVRIGVIYRLKELLPASEMLSLIQEELKRPSLSTEYRKNVVALEESTYEDITKTMEPSSTQVKELLERILEVKPEAYFALESLARWHYHNKDYQTSYDMFSKLLSPFPEEKVKNLKGLMLSLIRLGKKPEKAVKIIMEKAEIEDNEIKLAILKEVLSTVDPSGPLVKGLAENVLAISPKDFKALVSLAWREYLHGNYRTAHEMFFNIYQKYPSKKDELSGLIYSLIKLGEFDDALNFYEQEKFEDTGLKRDILGAKLALLDPSTEEVRILAEEILKEFPDDLSTQSSLAWWYYNHGEFKTAYEKFQKLYQNDPLNEGALSGLLNSLVGLKEFDQFKRIVEQLEMQSDGTKKNLGWLYAKIASLMDKKEEYDKAELYMKKSLSFTPQNISRRTYLAWILFKQKRVEEALNIVLSLYEKKKSAKLAETILLFYEKLGRIDDALVFVDSLKEKRSNAYKKIVSGFNFEIYRDKAKAAYENERYQEAETYFTMALIENPEETEMNELLGLSKYKQTRLFKSLSSIEGLPGFTWGGIAQDLKRDTGTKGTLTVNQGIEWVKLPGDIIFSTFAEYGYRNRTRDNLYYYARSKTLGLELERSPFKLGTKYSWVISPEQDKTDLIKSLYLRGYQEWYKFMKRKLRKSWLKFEAFSGSTYGRITHDLDNRTGTGISGYINQGIDWFTLPGEITFNTYVEYRYSFRSRDNFYYNAQSPGLGMMFTKSPFELGIEYFWKNFTEQKVTEQRWEVYLRWYYDWDLKSYINKVKKAAFRSRDYEERSRQHERRHEGR